jgi:hypothetical protein
MDALRSSYKRCICRNNEKGLNKYRKITSNSKFNLITDTEIEGDIISDLSTWYLHPNKDDIINTVNLFKQHLRSISSSTDRLGTKGSPGPGINTPILQTVNDYGYDISDFIFDFELAINNNDPKYALSEVNIERASKIINDFKYALQYSEFPMNADPLLKTEIGKDIFRNFTLNKDVQWVINCFNARSDMHYSYPICPELLINTDLGHKILNEMKSTSFSNPVFCHNALHYKNFVLRDDKLIAIKGWEYSGYYPPELEDIMEKYLSKLL